MVPIPRGPKAGNKHARGAMVKSEGGARFVGRSEAKYPKASLFFHVLFPKTDAPFIMYRSWERSWPARMSSSEVVTFCGYVSASDKNPETAATV